jgi:hypothetical protein
MVGLKRHPRALRGRCGACTHLALCNGSSRVRAQQITDDAWAEDPACYLTDDEIGVSAADYGTARVSVKPFVPVRRAP